MPPDRPSLLAWTVAVTYALGAYAVHLKGVMLELDPRFFWYHLVTHFRSASAMAAVLVVDRIRRNGVVPSREPATGVGTRAEAGTGTGIEDGTGTGNSD